jgi:hypothetical protein
MTGERCELVGWLARSLCVSSGRSESTLG